MALSSNVEESLREAEGNLRNALHWSAKNEKPYVSVMIADMISKIDTLIQLDKFSDKLEEQFKNKGFDGFGGPF